MTTSLQKSIWNLSMILAPLLIVISQFFWVNGVLTITAGVLQVFAYFFWIFAFQGMFQLLQESMPRYAVVGFFVAVLSCIGGNNFGVDGIYGDLMGVTTQAQMDEMHNKIGGAAVAYLFLPGLLFPLSLLVLGINLIRTQSVTFGIGLLLCIAAIGFPLSRVPRIDWIAHLDNFLLLISHVLVGLRVTQPKLIRKTA